MMSAPVFKIVRFGLNVGDLERACAFYENALGFSRLQSASARSDRALLRLGEQELELQRATGRPYPQPRAANDPWFQHLAIAVSDMAQAYKRLSRFAQQPISQMGPQLLPPSTGSVTAYKFRDPDGHPLELSYIPGSDWLSGVKAGADNPFLGIDHSGIAARDLDASVRFYTDVLGLTDAQRLLNQGPEQDQLDGLPAARVDIAVLRTAAPGPHIELLHYRSPLAGAANIAVDSEDVAATRLVMQITGGSGALRQDPDGHWLELSR